MSKPVADDKMMDLCKAIAAAARDEDLFWIGEILRDTLRRETGIDAKTYALEPVGNA
jgi:hypothetical protein